MINPNLLFDPQLIGKIYPKAGVCHLVGYAYFPHREYTNENGKLLAVNVVGTPEGVQAFWADLLTNKKYRIQGYLLNVETGRDQSWMKSTQTFPQHRLTNYILYRPEFVEFSKDDKEAYFWAEESNPASTVKRFIALLRKIVRVVVFDEWFSYIWAAGVDQQLVVAAVSEGMNVWVVKNDPAGWENIISNGLRWKELALP